MCSLKGMSALVTGASGGIGAAIARDLHKQGAHVVLHGTRAEKLQHLAEELKDRVEICCANLSDKEQLQTVIPYVIEKCGKIDILVNNAGITRDQLFMRMKEEDFLAVLNVNLIAASTLMQASIKYMMKKKFGRIINITSVVASMGNPGQANYCAAKSGVTGLSKALAQEVASRNITVNCIAPGFIETAMTNMLNDEQKKRITENIPMNRMGQPEDISGVVSFLCSQSAAYITGQTLHVNGGLLMV